MIFQRAIESKEYMANSKAMLSKLRSLKKSLAISSVLTLITGLILFYCLLKVLRQILIYQHLL